MPGTRVVLVLLTITVLATACSAGSPAPRADERALSIEVARAALADDYDPIEAGEEPPPGFRQSLTRDAILPVYVPRFVPADHVDWRADSLVIGVHLEGEARAYPVGFLNYREMVIDNHRGIPTLVTW